uniref:Uncharacterized protein n=1 Tax=Amphora coffeiformis TaxID=265554 RepID=A0A7S3KZM6_9STRA
MNPFIDNVHTNESNKKLPIVADNDDANGDHPQVNDVERSTPLGRGSSANRRQTRLLVKQQQQQLALKNKDLEGLNLKKDLVNTDLALAASKDRQPKYPTHDAASPSQNIGSTNDGHQSIQSVFATSTMYTSDEAVIEKNQAVGTMVLLQESQAQPTQDCTSRNNHNESRSTSTSTAKDSHVSFVPPQRVVRGKSITRLNAVYRSAEQLKPSTHKAPSSSQKDYAIMFGAARQNARNILQQWIRANQALENGAAPVVILHPISSASLPDPSRVVPASPNEWFQLYVQQYIPAMQKLLKKRYEVLAVADEIVEKLCQAGAKFSLPHAPYTHVSLPLVIKHISEQFEVKVLGRKWSKVEIPSTHSPSKFQNTLPRTVTNQTQAIPGVVPSQSVAPSRRTSLRLAARQAAPIQETINTTTNASIPKSCVEMPYINLAPRPPMAAKMSESTQVAENLHCLSVFSRANNTIDPNQLMTIATPDIQRFSPELAGHNMTTYPALARGVTPSPAPTKNIAGLHVHEAGHHLSLRRFTPSPESYNLPADAPPTKALGDNWSPLSLSGDDDDDWSPIPLSQPPQSPLNLADADLAFALLEVPSFEQVLLDQRMRTAAKEQDEPKKAPAGASHNKRKKNQRRKRRRFFR